AVNLLSSIFNPRDPRKRRVFVSRLRRTGEESLHPSGVPMRQMVSVIIGLLMLGVLVGCGPKRPKIGVVSGKLTYKGRPLSGAALLLYPPNDSDANPLNISVDQEGNFRIADIPTGEYKIVIEGTEGAVQADLRNIPPEKLAEVKEKLAGMNTPP